MGSNARAFTRVFQLAQEILGKTFGMELVELRSRAELEKGGAPSGGGGGDELDEVQKATTVKKKSAAAGSKTYILRSTLHPVIIERAAQTYPEILEAETADTVLEDVDDDEDTPALRVHGSIIAWNTGDDLGPTGILYVILALILINGRVLGDSTSLTSFPTKTHPTPQLNCEHILNASRSPCRTGMYTSARNLPTNL